MGFRILFTGGLSVAGCLALSTASAITTIESNAGVQFNFTNPGARSLGMAGAFTGLADDATAAYSNPAGLSILRRPEVSFEYRDAEFTTPFANEGRLLGEPTGIGVDTIAGVRSAEVDSSIDSASFFSFVLPGDTLTFGFYRHQIADFETAYRSNGPIVQTRGTTASGVPFISRANPSDNRVELDIANWGLSVSYRVSDNFSIGGGLSYYDYNFDTRTIRFPLTDTDGDGSVSAAERADPANFNQAPFAMIDQRGDDNDIGFNVGFLWSLNDRWSLGLVYRTGGEFNYDWTVSNSAGQVTNRDTTEFSMPDTLGVGLAFRATEQFTIAFDVNHVTYSDLTNEVFFAGNSVPTDSLNVDDGTEYRLGVEYVFATTNPFAIRAGIWQDPDHQVAFQGVAIPATNDLPPAELLARNQENTRATFFIPGDDEIHYSLGAGVAFERFQIDAAFDASDRVDTFSFSTVIRF